MYVFSGARPSSGAASSACSKALDFSDTPLALDAAAPEDGQRSAKPLFLFGH